MDEQKKKDPIPALFHRLEAAGLMTQADWDALDADVLAEVDDAVKFADESPEPDADQLYADVYSA